MTVPLRTSYQPEEQPKCNNAKMENTRSSAASQNMVPLWTCQEVSSWARRSGFPSLAEILLDARVDGDLLLQLDERSLKEDVGMTNGIQRKRFMRELNALRRSADYSACDAHHIADFLAECVGCEYRAYAYNLIRSDLSLYLMRRLSDSDLHDSLKESGIESTIHRLKIIEAVREWNALEDLDETGSLNGSVRSLDTTAGDAASAEVVVVSPGASRGSEQLASLVAVHLQLRGLVVFCGKASADGAASVLRHLRCAKHLVLVLSSGDSLDASFASDLHVLHSVVASAFDAGCNVIPLVEDFALPAEDRLPESVRALCHASGVRWAHDYQDACIDKLECLVRGQDYADRLRRTSSPSISGRSTPVKSIHNASVERKLRSRNVSAESFVKSCSAVRRLSYPSRA